MFPDFFPNCEATRLISQLSRFLVFFDISFTALNNELENLVAEVGVMEFKPNLWNILNLTSRAKVQKISKC
jgi:hypothetical protein